MNITSSVFEHNGNVPRRYTCDGENINPPLTVSGAPEGTVSFALIVDDPDAPRGTWIHWTLWNIAPRLREIAENSIPQGAVEGMTSFGKSGYGGPCPHSGTHRYFFKLYALDTALSLESSADAIALARAMQNHILTHAELTGTYARK